MAISIKSQLVEEIHAELALKITTMAIDRAEFQRASKHRHERGGVVEKPLHGIASRERTEITPAIVVVGAVDHIERVADPRLTAKGFVIAKGFRPQRTMKLKLTQI